MSTGYPDGQKITQWIGAPIAQAVAAPIGAGQIVIGPTRLSSWASVIVALKPTGGPVTITVTQTIPNGPGGLVLQQQVIVPAGGTVFESFVLFGANVTITLQGAVGGTTVDYAVTPSNTTTNAQVLTNATINVQKNEVLVAAEPTLDFVDANGIVWTLTDDATNTRVKVSAAQPALADTVLLSAAALVDIQNIPQTYNYLQALGLIRLDVAAATSGVVVLFNGDTAANYTMQDTEGVDATLGATSSNGSNGIEYANSAGATAPANSFTPFDLTIFNYTYGGAHKTVLAHSYVRRSATSQIQDIWGGTWISLAAINRVMFEVIAVANYVAGSRFSLYGRPGL